MRQLVAIGKHWVRADVVTCVATEGEDVVVALTDGKVVRAEFTTGTAANAAAVTFANAINAVATS